MPHKKTSLPLLFDFIRKTERRFKAAKLAYAHGTDNAWDEAVFMTLEGLGLPIDHPIPNRRLTTRQLEKLEHLVERRIKTRTPAPYLLNKAYLQGIPFYVDERVIVPRSYLSELLLDDDGFPLIDAPEKIKTVLDLCTGSGCLAIVAAKTFPKARIDAVDLSEDALDVARKNVSDHGLSRRIRLFQGNLFAPLKDKKYDLIITNPPYVDATGMKRLPPECRHEPKMALAAGKDGLDIVHRILKEAPRHLTENGALLAEIGRCGPALEKKYPRLPFLWLDTEASSGEFFWITRKQLCPK